MVVKRGWYLSTVCHPTFPLFLVDWAQLLEFGPLGSCFWSHARLFCIDLASCMDVLLLKHKGACKSVEWKYIFAELFASFICFISIYNMFPIWGPAFRTQACWGCPPTYLTRWGQWQPREGGEVGRASQQVDGWAPLSDSSRLVRWAEAATSSLHTRHHHRW